MSIVRLERKKGIVYKVYYYDGAKQRTKSFDRKKDAEAFEAKVRLLKRTDDLADLDAGKEPLGEFIDEWWKRHGELFLAAKTQQTYRYLIERFIRPTLGKQPLRKITASSVVALREKVVRESGDATARTTLAILQGILERAVEWDEIRVNPVKGVKKPHVRRMGSITALSPNEVEELVSRFTSRRDSVLVRLMAYAGLRPGEALALTWEDVGGRVLNVDKALSLGEEKGTKTGQTRQIRLCSTLKQDLLAFKFSTRRREGLIFPRRDGRPWTEFDYRNWRKRTWRKAAPEGMRPYDLRHSYASLLFQEGMNPAEIAEQMGHSIAVLLNTYAHVIEELRGQPRRDAETLIKEARLTQTLPAGEARAAQT